MGTFIALTIAVTWVVEHWKICAAVLVALILVIRARRKARYQKAIETINAAQQSKPRPATPSTPSPSAPKPSAPQPTAKPEFIKPPKAQNRMCLTYFYPDVEFIVPPAYESTARSVPPLKQITLTADGETEDIYLSYEGNTFGRMRENRLRKMVRDFDRDGRSVLAASCAWTDKPMFSLGFYESLDTIRDRWKNDEDYKEFTLTGNSNAEMQENIGLVDEGDPVEFVYDYEKDKHAAYADGFEVGYCPASAEEYLNEHDDVEARILSITEKDNGKYSVKVMVCP